MTDADSETKSRPNSEANTATPAPPILRVISTTATPEEIAAIVAVFASLGGAEPTAARPRREWGAPHRQLRRTLPHGPGGWRASALPR